MNISMWILALEKSDHDLLVELSTKMELIHMLLINHLEHHFVYNITLLGALLSLAAAGLIYVLKSRKLRYVKMETQDEGE